MAHRDGGVTNGVTCHSWGSVWPAPPSCTSHNFITELWYITPSIQHHRDIHTSPVTAVTPVHHIISLPNCGTFPSPYNTTVIFIHHQSQLSLLHPHALHTVRSVHRRSGTKSPPGYHSSQAPPYTTIQIMRAQQPTRRPMLPHIPNTTSPS